MPAHRKSPGLKLIDGSREPERTPKALHSDPSEAVSAPVAPDWLPNVHAKNEFDKLAAILVRRGALNEGNRLTLEHACALHGKIIQSYSSGAAPTTSSVDTLRKMLNELGLGGGVGASGTLPPHGDPTKPGNTFADITPPPRKRGK